MNYRHKTQASNILDTLRGDAHKQWDAIETKDGLVLVARRADGTFNVYMAYKFEKARFDKDGFNLHPDHCEVCGSAIEETDEGIWYHASPPLNEHPATLEKRK
jgi:hypothetical protein